MNSSLSQDLIGASIVLQVLWWNVIANGGYLFFYSVHLHYREEKRVIEGITLELKGMIFYVYQEVVLSLKLFVKGLLRFAEIQGWDSVTNLSKWSIGGSVDNQLFWYHKHSLEINLIP